MRSSIARPERTPDLSLTLPDGAREAVTALLADALDGSTFSDSVVLLVTATAREAEELAQGLGSWMDAETVGHFPSWETLPHERLSPRSDTEIGRASGRESETRKLLGIGVKNRPEIGV